MGKESASPPKPVILNAGLQSAVKNLTNPKYPESLSKKVEALRYFCFLLTPVLLELG
jgi:hypothetical protein